MHLISKYVDAITFSVPQHESMHYTVSKVPHTQVVKNKDPVTDIITTPNYPLCEIKNYTFHVPQQTF
jgi:hypothetical protein